MAHLPKKPIRTHKLGQINNPTHPLDFEAVESITLEKATDSIAMEHNQSSIRSGSSFRTNDQRRIQAAKEKQEESDRQGTPPPLDIVQDVGLNATTVDETGKRTAIFSGIADGQGTHKDEEFDRFVAAQAFNALTAAQKAMQKYRIPEGLYRHMPQIIEESSQAIAKYYKEMPVMSVGDKAQTTLSIFKTFPEKENNQNKVVGFNIGDSMVVSWNPFTQEFRTLGRSAVEARSNMPIQFPNVRNKTAELPFYEIVDDGTIIFTLSDGILDYLKKKAQKQTKNGFVFEELDPKAMAEILKDVNPFAKPQEFADAITQHALTNAERIRRNLVVTDGKERQEIEQALTQQDKEVLELKETRNLAMYLKTYNELELITDDWDHLNLDSKVLKDLLDAHNKFIDAKFLGADAQQENLTQSKDSFITKIQGVANTLNDPDKNKLLNAIPKIKTLNNDFKKLSEALNKNQALPQKENLPINTISDLLAAGFEKLQLPLEAIDDNKIRQDALEQKINSLKDNLQELETAIRKNADKIKNEVGDDIIISASRVPIKPLESLRAALLTEDAWIVDESKRNMYIMDAVFLIAKDPNLNKDGPASIDNLFNLLRSDHAPGDPSKFRYDSKKLDKLQSHAQNAFHQMQSNPSVFLDNHATLKTEPLRSISTNLSITTRRILSAFILPYIIYLIGSYIREKGNKGKIEKITAEHTSAKNRKLIQDLGTKSKESKKITEEDYIAKAKQDLKDAKSSSRPLAARAKDLKASEKAFISDDVSNQGPLGHYEAILTEKKNESDLNIEPVIEVPKGIKLAKPSQSPLPESAPPSRLFSEKMAKKRIDFKNHPERERGYLFTEKERDAIYEAIENNKNLVKIRRVFTGSPGRRLPRQEKEEKKFTELEKKLELEFSVLIGEDREPIALFRGKEFKIGAGGLGEVKFGQRLRDGKFVAVKIQKYNIENLNTMRAHLKLKNTQREDLLILLENAKERLTAPQMTNDILSDLKTEIEDLNQQLLLNQQDIKNIEEGLKIFEQEVESTRGFVREEEQLARKQNVQTSGAERQSGDIGKFYAVQTLFEGQALIDHMEKNSPIPIRNIEHRLKIGLMCLKALKELHDKNIVHADIKPENMILICDPNAQDKMTPQEIKIIDFGSGIQLEEGETSRKVGKRGTPDYRAPENIKRGTLYKSSDIYSMGRTFDYLLHESDFSDDEVRNQIFVLRNKMKFPDPNNRITADQAIKKMEEIILNYEKKQQLGPRPV